MWFCRLIKNCFALKDVDLRWVRVSANAAVSPRCLCVPSFVSLAVGRPTPSFQKSYQVLLSFSVKGQSCLLNKKKCACLGGAERCRLYQDCHITLWTVFKISLGSVYDDMIKSVLCINFANGCQEDFIFCLILLSDLLAKQNQNSTHETMAEINSVIQNECHTPTA